MFKCTKEGVETETTWYFINGAYVSASTVCELGLNPVFVPDSGGDGFMMQNQGSNESNQAEMS